MNKKLLSALILVSFLAGLAPSVMADAEISPSSEAKKLFRNTAKKIVDVACMQQAIEKRDSAIIAGVDAYYTVVKTALQTRKEAMKTAWTIATAKERRVALKNAWKTYQETINKARNNFRMAKKSAWQQFNIDKKTCGTSGASDDPTNQSVDNTL